MRNHATKRAAAPTILLALLAAGLTGCGAPGVVDTDGRGDVIPEDDASAPTTQTLEMNDPVENAFTVNVPEGWDSVAYSSGDLNFSRNMVSSVSPDGKTVIFVGDPKLPMYWSPEWVNPQFQTVVDVIEYWETKAYEPAETYLPDYVTRKFGELPGFEITSVAPEPDLLADMEQGFASTGSPFSVSTAEVRFEYEASGTPIHATVVGWSMNGGQSWMSDVYGLATDRDIEQYRPMLIDMVKSIRTTPEYSARSRANHEQSMAQIQAFGEELTRQHNANMAWIQQSAAAHQARMEAIWAQGDASMQNYYNRMDSMDHTQRDFLNYINEEETVSGGSTGTRQVATGATNYWVNKNDGTYVGGDINFGDAQLRQMGLNPNDYEQVTVVK